MQKQIEYFETKRHGQTLEKDLKEGLDLLAMHIPTDLHLDRFLRYESSLERAFDRTLNQLERLQRMRRGQAAQPQINVNVSSL